MVAETSVPLRNPAPIMLERGERKPLLPGRQNHRTRDRRLGRLTDWEVPSLLCGHQSGPGREAPCGPTGTDPMPVVSPGDSSFAVSREAGGAGREGVRGEGRCACHRMRIRDHPGSAVG